MTGVWKMYIVILWKTDESNYLILQIAISRHYATRITTENKKSPYFLGLFKRRWRDLNPCAGCPTYRISSADPSTTWVHLHIRILLNTSVLHYTALFFFRQYLFLRVFLYLFWEYSCFHSYTPLFILTLLLLTQNEFCAVYCLLRQILQILPVHFPISHFLSKTAAVYP